MSAHQTRVRETRQASRQRIVDAATELVRRTPYAALTVDDVMREAGFGRTIFYRHFDDLPDLLRRAARAPIEELFEAHSALAGLSAADPELAVRSAIEAAVAVFAEHGPLLRAIVEAAPSDAQIAAGQEAIRARFDELLAGALVSMPGVELAADPAETARALNLLNTSYLVDAFGGEPRVTPETATRTLVAIWNGVVGTPR
jgi:AcrR family transcriptional regulator